MTKQDYQDIIVSAINRWRAYWRGVPQWDCIVSEEASPPEFLPYKVGAIQEYVVSVYAGIHGNRICIFKESIIIRNDDRQESDIIELWKRLTDSIVIVGLSGSYQNTIRQHRDRQMISPYTDAFRIPMTCEEASKFGYIKFIKQLK